MRLTLDRLGTPIEVGDTVTYSDQKTGSYGTTFSVDWYEGIVLEIGEDLLNYHNFNRELVIRFDKYPVDTKAQIKSNGNAYDKKVIDDVDDDPMTLQSNSVITKTKTIPALAKEYAEFFV